MDCPTITVHAGKCYKGIDQFGCHYFIIKILNLLLLFVHPSETMRTIWSSWGWGWSLWVQRWLVRLIGAWKVLWQCGQGMVAAVGDLLVLFFSCLSVLFSYSYPVGFAGFCTLVNRCLPLPSVSCSLLLSDNADVKAFNETFMCLCSAFSGLLRSTSLVAAHHRTVS